MKKVLAVLALLFLATPSYAGCVMSLEGSDRAIKAHGMIKHTFTGQRLAALVEVLREKTPEFALEPDTTVIWVLEIPQDSVALIIEINEAASCATYKPEEAPLAAARQIILEVSRRTAGA